jgi:transposase/uncharacterized protein Smg (DUF494 family)
MVTMKQKQEIILRHFREGKSYRSISRNTGISRQIVKKYIEEYREAKSKFEENNEAFDSEELIQDLLESPRYNSRNRKKRKLTLELTTRIDALLLENTKKRQNKQYKQLLKKIDILEQLHKEGFNIGYTAVCSYVNEALDKSKETFIKQIYQPGSTCEFDWADVKLFIDGKMRTFQLALFTSAFSNYRFAILYAKQNTQCFQESHAEFFEKTQGVFHTMVYDNMRVAVKRFVGPSEKEATDGLLQLSLYYQFDFRFCNARKGNEKGHVERGVEYVRRKAFAVKDSFPDIDEANKYLEQVCDELNRRKDKKGNSSLELFEEEKKFMPKSPRKFCGSIKESVRVDKYGTITVETCHYSVPEKYTGKMIDVRIFSNKIVCYDGFEKLCSHTKKYGFGEWSLQLEHYLKTLMRKPGALKGSLALSQSNQRFIQIYNDNFKEYPKEFIELISYMKTKNKTIAEIEIIIQKLQQISTNEIRLDKIKMLGDQVIEVVKINPSGEIERRALKQLFEISNLYSAKEKRSIKG